MNSVDVTALGGIVGACLAILGFACGLYFAIRPDIQIWKIARKLGLKDKGAVKAFTTKLENNDVAYVKLTHRLCKTQVRVGIKLSTGEPVRWCHVCECEIGSDGNGDDDDDDGIGQPNNPVPPEVIDYTKRFYERMRY